MDSLYTNRTPYERRKNRSLQHLNHQSLAPLSLRLPLSDPESLRVLDQLQNDSQSRSEQATQTNFSSSPRSSTQKPQKSGFLKSKSSTYLMSLKNAPTFAMTPGDSKSLQARSKGESRLDSLSQKDWNDSDWFLRTGAILASSARESKGQAWLVSRASSTSLARLQDGEGKDYARERERESYSRRSSVRGSIFESFDEDFSSPQSSSSSSIDPISRCGSQSASRLASRAVSRHGSRIQLFSSPTTADSEGYFDYKSCAGDDCYESDLNLSGIETGIDREIEQQEEATIKKLVQDYSQGLGGWIERILGLNFLAESGVVESGLVEFDSGTENGSETSENTSSDYRSHRTQNFQSFNNSSHAVKIELPPPQDGEISVWQDTAWILSVAARVLF